MTNPEDESRLKELIKTAIVEVLEEQGFVRPPSRKPTGNAFLNSTAKTVAVWVAIVVTAVLVYNVFSHP
jgi:hypothetical protein